MNSERQKIRTLMAALVCTTVLAGGQKARAEAGGAGGAGGASGVPGVASRYVTRMQERVQKADEAALRGSQLLADGDYQGAIAEFQAALDLLPDAPLTRERKNAYTAQFASASVKLAQQRADEAEYEEARNLLEAVLAPGVDPDNFAAKQLLERLDDPEYYSPALTPEHLQRVRTVEAAHMKARGYIEIGDFDRAEQEYWSVLNQDRYNKGARMALEEVERHRMDYYETSRNHTRAEFLRRVAEGWELPVPVSITAGDTLLGPKGDKDTDRIAEIEQKLKSIIIPSIEFVNTPLDDCLEFLRTRAQEIDDDPDPNTRGVDFILDLGTSLGGGGGAPAAPGADAGGGPVFDTAPAGGAPGGFGGGGGAGDTQVTLQLNNVPLGEALGYTLKLANLKYKVEPQAVVILPVSAPDTELYTNTYIVPPSFLSSAPGGDGGGGAAAPDPFAAPAAGGANAGIPKRQTAKQVLEAYGVVFGPGSSATYNPGSSTLVVRQTQDQMDLVEAIIEAQKISSEKQIFITSKFLEIGEDTNQELGFDWLVGPFSIGSPPRVFGAGGTPGNQLDGVSPQDFSFTQPGAATPVGSNPVTAGIRSGANAIDGDSIDALISESAGDTQDRSATAPAIFGIAGIFTDPQFQVMIRALNQKKGLDILSAPSVLARSGQRAQIEVIREFIYPTEYDPPEIPTSVGTGGGIGGGGLGQASTSSFPVTPATPAAFETRNTGVTLEVDPVLGPDDLTIDLNLSPEVVEFEGFINYGSPINSAAIDQFGNATTVELTENRIEMPVFSTRKVTTQVTIWDGQTVAIGGLIREDVQDVQDKVPLLGDLPAVGRLFRNNVELHLKRNLTIFVKAKIVDPAGLSIRPDSQL